MAPLAHFSRRYRFSAMHRLHSPSLSDDENRAAYGKCNNPYGHGHNYFIEVTVAGPVDPETGFVVDLPRLDALVQRKIIERFDHRSMNCDPVFSGSFVPSTENLTIEAERVFRREVPQLAPSGQLKLFSIRIEETANNSFDLPSQAAESAAARPAMS